MSRVNDLTMKARDALETGSTGYMSTGEALAVALVLNRIDWLSDMGYTIAQALGRIDDDWIQAVPAAARLVNESSGTVTKAQTAAREETVLTSLSASEVDINATLVTYGNAPGYRSISLTFDMERLGSTKNHRLRLHIGAEDGVKILRHVLDVNKFAWSSHDPLDYKEKEERPAWIDHF